VNTSQVLATANSTTISATRRPYPGDFRAPSTSRTSWLQCDQLAAQGGRAHGSEGGRTGVLPLPITCPCRPCRRGSGGRCRTRPLAPRR
jgi:hypothetical protein